jgi:hypothetical protein
MSYFTSASLDETMPTLRTLAEADLASDELCWAWMIDANWEPSSSRLTRVATGVVAAKNFTQLALMVAAALPVAGDEDVGDAAGDEAGGEELELAGGLLLPQAVTKAATAQAPSIAAVCLLLFIQLFSN